MTTKALLLSAAACCFALPAGGALAQAAPDPTATQQSTSTVDDVVVTARRTSESVQTVPLAISVLGAEQLAERNVVTISDVARTTPNFFVQTSSADTSGVLLTIRGQSQQDSILTVDAPVGVYVDGMNYTRSTNLEAALVDVERVEILRGPQGTLYGKNTTGGAISISTRQPDFAGVGGYLDLTAGDFGRLDATGVFNAPLIDDTLGVRFVVQRRSRDGYGHDGLGNDLNDKDFWAYRGNLLFQPNDRIRVQISTDYELNESGGPIIQLTNVNPFPSGTPGTPPVAPSFVAIAVESGLITPADLGDPAAAGRVGAALFAAQGIFASYLNDGFYNSSGTFEQGSRAETYGGSINLSADLNDYLEFRSISGVRWIERKDPIDLDGTPFGLLDATLTGESRNVSQELQLAHFGPDRFNWIVGAYYNRESGNEGSTANALRAINPANPNVTDGDVVNSSWAVYGQTITRLTDSLRATLGLRWTEETKELTSFNRSGPGGATCSIPVAIRVGGACRAEFEDKFEDYSYLASLDWTVRDGLLVYGRTARGFKGGGQNLRGTGTSDSFAAFSPETVTDYEIGVKSEFFDRRLRINTALFYAEYEDIQRTIVQASPGGAIISLVTNAAGATIQGLEVDVTARVNDNLTLSGTLGLTDAEYDSFVDITGDRTDEPFQFPDTSYTLTADYAVPTDFGQAKLIVDWSWRSDTQLVGSAIFQDSLAQEAYGLLNTRLTFTFDAWDADISLFAKNIADEEYAVSGIQFDNSLGWNVVYAGEPRTVGVQLVKRFGN